MIIAKRRKTSHTSSQQDVNNKRNDLSLLEEKDDERREDVFFPVLSQVPVQADGQNTNICSDIIAPLARYIPTLDSFVSVRTSNPVRTKLNLPNLIIPARLQQREEDSIINLRVLLKNIGFDVVHRATLAFFAIGSQLDIRKAAKHFVNLHNLSKTVEFKCPRREVLQSMENYGLVEGFARHRDGTFGPLVHGAKYNLQSHQAAYIAREALCYILSMVDLSLIRNGLTSVTNARNLSWRVFAPFEVIKYRKIMTSCCPIRFQARFIIDPGMYGMLAHRVSKKLLHRDSAKVTCLLSADEVRLGYPHIVLPESITGLSSNKLIKHLSVDEQLKMSFFC